MPRPVAFTHEGTDYKAFPEQGSYFGIDRWPIGRASLVLMPMNTDGSPALDACVGEVVNMGEQGDDLVLAEINAEFGTSFRYSDFPGR